MSDTPKLAPKLQRRLALSLRLTLLGLIAERATQAFWPLWSVLCILFGALAFGVQDVLPVGLVLGGLAGMVILALGFALRGARRFEWPSEQDVSGRLDATLPGQPLQAMHDSQAMGQSDPGSAALWHEHRRRMMARLANVRPVQPDLNQTKADPFALRYVALLALVSALLFGSVTRLQSIPHIGAGGSDLAQGPSWEGWLQPPDYTGLPTIYLNDITGEISAPQGSDVKLRLYGNPDSLQVEETVSGRPLSTDATLDFQIKRDGEIAVSGAGGRIWSVVMTPDAPPAITLNPEVDVTYEGEVTIRFDAQDDHGVIAGAARISLDLDAVDRRYGRALEPEDREVIDAPLFIPVVGDRKEFTGSLVADFSQHPWANLPVQITFEARDGSGQVGQSQSHAMTLHGRRFFDPLAAVVTELRQALLWNRDYARDAAQILRAVGNDPNGLFRKETDALRYQKLIKRIERTLPHGMSDKQRDEIAQTLWDLAMALEEIDLEDARQRLERARQRLEEAMKNGASKDQIERLMQELREATNDYMRQLGREQAQNPEPQQQGDPQDRMTMSMDDLQAMRDKIQELMEQGRMDEAMEALRQYNEMLENMQVTQGGAGEGGQTPGEQAMEGLSETLRDQQNLSDDAFRDLQDQFGNRNEGQGQRGDQQGQSSEESLAERQRALRDELNRQRGSLPGQDTEGGQRAEDALDQADEAMRGAEEALRDGDMAGALDEQSRAMEAMRDGMRGLGEAMAEQQQRQRPGQQGSPQNGTPNGDQRDPLGRNPGQEGSSETGEGMLQGDDIYRRAEELLNELRKRSGELERPELERRYLDRLLDRF